jgi:receptor protein-tyrosine kinase
VNIIEQAARRLEELRRSGVEIPLPTPGAKGHGAASDPAPIRPRGAVPTRDGVVARPAPLALPDPSTPVVELDLRRLASMGYVTPDNPRTQIANEFRVIKRPILSNVQNRSAAPVERANLIMVTSSLPGEGKTFVAINLAISIAMELDTTVLLVDADVSRPSVLQRLNLPPSAGLLDVLTDNSRSVSDVLLRTSLDKLSVLPAGAPKGHATELLASVQMARLVEELANRYPDRIIVFDAPPLLASTESRVLATHMGQVVVVVESERTPHHTVATALTTIEACPVVLPLLNKASRPDVGSYYGYYGPEAK